MFATILTAALALAISSADLQAAPAHPDTTNVYLIDNHQVKNFDGSQLAGKTITSYNITTTDGKHPVRIHNIVTNGKAADRIIVTSSQVFVNERVAVDEEKVETGNTIYIVDGERISSEDFNKIDAKKVKSISVNKNTDFIKSITNDPKYQAVIIVETK